MSYHSEHRPKAHRAKVVDNKKILNLPSFKLPITPLTREEIKIDFARRVSRVSRELQRGFDFIQGYQKSVTFFGSARISPGDRYYKKAIKLGELLALEGYAVITGGGPGIMEAANRGAWSVKDAHSLGLTIKLPEEQVINPYVTAYEEFYYFFTRKVCLTFAAEAYVYFPGGFGTLDEFFEILTLVQTKKIEPVPIFCVGSDFWDPFDQFINKTLYTKFKMITKGDMNLYKITDDEKEIIKQIKKSPIRVTDNEN